MFSESEKLIFSCTINGSKRFFDPLALRRSLLRESAGKFYSWWEDSIEPGEHYQPVLPPIETMPPSSLVSPDEPGAISPAAMLADAHRTARVMSALDAQDRVAAVVRAVFGIPDFDPATGANPESECWRVLDEYTEWLAKNASGGGS